MSGLHASMRVDLGDLALDVALTVEAGTTVALVGPNGAGKTTVLRALAGLVPLDAGRVAVDGTVLDEPATGTWVAPERRSVGLVPQDHVLFPHLSVLDNVAFGLRARGRRRRQARLEAAQWLAVVGLGDRGDDRPAALSGGQAQRVALARALAVRPALLLLDEPLAALDATTRAATRRELRAHLAAHDGARVVVTHDPVDAAALADRLVVLEAGRAVQEGTVDELRRRPRSPFVADLLAVNLYRGVADGTLVRLDDGGTLAVASAPSGPVDLVVHPRSVVLSPTRPAGTARNVWPGTVVAVDRDGGRARVTVAGTPSVVAEVTPEAVAALDLRPGSEVWASVKATEVAAHPA